MKLRAATAANTAVTETWMPLTRLRSGSDTPQRERERVRETVRHMYDLVVDCIPFADTDNGFKQVQFLHKARLQWWTHEKESSN